MVKNIFIICIIFISISCASTYKSEGYTFGNTGNPMDPIKKVHHIDKRKANSVVILQDYFKSTGKVKIKILKATECPWDKSFKISGGTHEKRKN